MIQRAFVYGDLLFETLRVHEGELLFWNDHYARLQYGSSVLLFQNIPSQEELHQVILNAVDTRDHMRVRLTLFRNANGYYLPDGNSVDYHVECFPHAPKENDSVKQVGIYQEYHKACNTLSNIKSGNALIYVLASIHASQQGWDDAIILNQHNRVCEASSSNLFLSLNGDIITPPLSEGCVAGIMRKQLINNWIDSTKQVKEQPVTLEMLNKAESIWFSNVISGVRKVTRVLL